jgi:outer membrane protein OmpA-like peptidoglycan-associated protein
VRRVRLPAQFPVAVWPPFVDALTLVLAAFVLLMLVGFVAQRALASRVRQRDDEVARLREDGARLRQDKARIERRLAALAPVLRRGLEVSPPSALATDPSMRGTLVEVEGGRVILQGEVLFPSGSDTLTARGQGVMEDLGRSLATLLAAERGQMLMVSGHTDDKGLRPGARFATNWELSTARALAVSRVLMGAGVPPGRIVASGFAEHHPRVANLDDHTRRRNRRIEVLVVPMTTVSASPVAPPGAAVTP